MRALLRRPLLVAFLGCAATACHGTGSTLREPDGYQGCATDENWQTFDGRELSGQLTLDDALAPRFTNLADGMALAASVKPTLAWQLSSTQAGKPTGDASCPALCPSCGPLATEHLPAVTGDVYDLQFSVAGSLDYRVLTTLQTFTPDDVTWGRWRGHAITLRPTRMTLKDNDITDGPYQPSKTIAFTVSAN